MTETQKCERCGGPLPEGALSGQCPRCLLEVGLEQTSGSSEDSGLTRMDGIETLAPGGSAPAGPRMPAAIGRYKILRLIGEGGMGAVYEAEQEQPRRTVALKVIKPGLASPQLLFRFEQEAQALGRLQHPGIAQIYEAGTADAGFGPQPYFAMEFIQGKTLRDYSDHHGLNTRDRLEIMAKVAEAVHHAHQRGLIHRDLKPGNIMVDETGQPKILDFGVARVTDSDAQATMQTDIGQLVGTLAYMSPEQVLADPLELDTRSDVYALGVILYELLAAKLPYDISKKIHEALRAIREEDPARLSSINRTYRGDIETIAAKALEKDKTRRYSSAVELSADIRHYLNDEPIVARPPSTTYQLQKFARRHKALVGGVAAVFVVLVGGVVVSTTQAFRASRAEHLAIDEKNRAVEAEHNTGLERDRANRNEAIAKTERNSALSAQAQTAAERDRANEQRLITIWRSLARESIRDSASGLDGDRAALLARQAMLIHARTPNQPQYPVEEALQQAAWPQQWSHQIPIQDIPGGVLSPDAARLAAVGPDGIVRLWDLRQSDPEAVLLRGSARMLGALDSIRANLKFSWDGTHLATGPSGLLWDLRDPGAEPTTLPVQRIIAGLALSPDGSRVALVDSAGTLRILNSRDAQSQPVELQVSRGLSTILAFSTDGMRLAVGSNGIQVWDLRNPSTQPTVLAGTQGLHYSMVFSPDGTRLAFNGDDNAVRVSDLAHPDVPPVIFRGSPGFVGDYVFSPDIARLAGMTQTSVLLWEVSNPATSPVQFHTGTSITSVAFSRDGLHLTAAASQVVYVWDLDRSQPPAIQGHQRPVSSLAVSQDARLLASGGEDKSARLWNLPALSAQAGTLQGHQDNVFSVGFLPTAGRLVSVSRDGAVMLWDPGNAAGPSATLQTRSGRISAAALSRDGAQMAVSGDDGAVRILDLSNPGAEPSLLPGRKSGILTLAYSSSGRQLAAGASDGGVRFWDLRNPKAEPIAFRDAGRVLSLTFLSGGDRLAAGSADGLRIYNLRSSNRLPVLFQRAQSTLAGAVFSPGATRMVTADIKGSLLMWDMSNPKAPPIAVNRSADNNPILSLTPSEIAVMALGARAGNQAVELKARLDSLAGRLISAAAFSPDGLHLFTGRGDGSVQKWPLWSEAADYLCTRVRRNLSMDEWRLYLGEGIPYERTCPSLPPGVGAPGGPK